MKRTALGIPLIVAILLTILLSANSHAKARCGTWEAGELRNDTRYTLRIRGDSYYWSYDPILGEEVRGTYYGEKKLAARSDRA